MQPHPSAAVGGTEEALGLDRLADRQLGGPSGHLAEGEGTDLEGDLPHGTGFDDLGGMRQTQVQGRQASRGVAQGAAFGEAAGQQDAVDACCGLGAAGGTRTVNQAAFSGWAGACADLRASSRSTAFIMMEGAVSALLFCTVR